jgi:DNA repair protein RecN (Recombination protein N)
MLKRLSIRNIAIIESLDLDFEGGLTIITGESGSGKSILLDAVGLAFGAKASPKESLRAGCTRGQVELLFELGALRQQPGFSDFLQSYELDLAPDETEILLTRELTASSSRSRINGVPVGRDALEALRGWVIDLHGQHELTSLFRPERQRAGLDAYGKSYGGAASSIVDLKREVAEAYVAWNSLKKQRETLMTNQKERLQQRDFLEFQCNELNEAELSHADEDVETRSELDLLNNAEKRQRVALQSVALLVDDGDSEGGSSNSALLDQLSLVEKTLAEGASYDPVLATLLNQVEGAHAELKAIAGELARYGDRVDMNPERLAALTDRLDRLEKLKRKYGPTLADVLATRDRVVAELASLETLDLDADALEARLAERETHLQEASKRLSDARRQVAAALKAVMLEQLQALAMPGVSFDVAFATVLFGPDGVDEVTFLFSANPGEPLRPLAKVASGGELSRFLLAMKVLTAENDGLLTLVFDEIDSGISGPTAKALAQKLAMLSQRLQVLAITHQPLLAAMGRLHLHVEKHVRRDDAGEETVQVLVQSLQPDSPERMAVLSRLVSGMESPDSAVEKFIRRLRAEAEAVYQQVAQMQPENQPTKTRKLETPRKTR